MSDLCDINSSQGEVEVSVEFINASSLAMSKAGGLFGITELKFNLESGVIYVKHIGRVGQDVSGKDDSLNDFFLISDSFHNDKDFYLKTEGVYHSAVAGLVFVEEG
ncbi:hypothetical protein MASR1M31_22110 [Porphyromonadaceae bacterium]